RRADLDAIIIAAASYPCPLILESLTFFTLNQSVLSRFPIDFRVGSYIFYDFCNVIPDGIDILLNLPRISPNFTAYVFYCTCRRLSNKLRSMVPILLFQIPKLGCPSVKVVQTISALLRDNPYLIKKMRPSITSSFPDINLGEVRELVAEFPSSLDDMALISIGYSLWLQGVADPLRKEEVETAFDELHSVIVDLLSKLELSENHVHVEKEDREESEEGEIELGELVEDVDANLEQPENFSPQIIITNFVSRIIESNIIKKNRVKDTLDRFSEITLAMNLGINTISSSDLEVLLKIYKKLPKNDLLNQ
ncbi:hypothetical protein MXB_1971, partial [Myxobolus squamalis]